MNIFKKLKFFLFLLILINCKSFSQDGWFWLNPLPQGNYLTDAEYAGNNIVYVSGYGGTMMKSTDNGVSFSVMQNKECGESIIFINELTGFSNSTNGILKTTNGGNNWRYIPAPVDSVNDFSTSPQISLYGLKNNKVYISNDLGESWNLSLTAYPDNIFYSLHFPTNNIGFVVGYKPTVFSSSRIHKTTNGGITWDTIPVNFRFRTNGVYFLNAQTGFVTTFANRNLLLKTTNGGAGWDTVYNFINGTAGQIKFFDQNNGYIRGNSDTWLTTNQGNNWTYSYKSKNTFLKNFNDGIGLDRYFLFRTTNGGTNWLDLTSGFMDSFYDVTFINSNTGFTGGNNFIYKTTNNGINWTPYYLGLITYTGVNSIVFPDTNTGFAGIDGGRFARTTNAGVNWQILETGQTDHLYGISFPSADTGYAVTKWGYNIKTINGGLNWSPAVNDSCQYEVVSFLNSLTGFTGGHKNALDNAIIKRTTNGGNSWTAYYPDSMYNVRDLCFSPNNTFFVAGYKLNSVNFNGVIARTTNLGDTWTIQGFPDRISAVYFYSALTGYASAENNIMYKTTNGGENWFATYCVNYFSSYGLYFTDDNTGYAVSPYGQIIKTTTGGGVLISVEPQSYVVPHTFNLHQNYPNPFNPSTKIKFDIPKAMNASLKIYDILGREVSVIVNDFLIPGTYSFDFDGSNFSSGVYFYVLTGDGFVESKKMLLVK